MLFRSQVRQPEMLEREPVSLIDRGRLLQQWQRLTGIARKKMRDAEQAQGFRIARRAPDDLLAQPSGGRQVAALQRLLGLAKLAVGEGGHRWGCMPR